MSASDRVTIVERFVGLVGVHDWSKTTELPPQDIQLLFELVAAAGFEPHAISAGNLTLDYLDGDGKPIGRKHNVNPFCGFVVLDISHQDNVFATGWLDSALRLVLFGLRSKDIRLNELVDKIIAEIERSQPFTPIQISAEGDLLQEPKLQPNTASVYPFFLRHIRPSDDLPVLVGIHGHVDRKCGGELKRGGYSDSNDVIVCCSCRVEFFYPKGADTYGKLSDHFGRVFPRPPGDSAEDF